MLDCLSLGVATLHVCTLYDTDMLHTRIISARSRLEENMADCVFCASTIPFAPDSRFLVYEDDLVAASHMTTQKDPTTYLGHLVLQSKRHVRDFSGLTPTEAGAVGRAIQRLSAGVKATTAAENVYAVFFAEVVPHLHVLLTARYPKTPERYWRMNILEWPEAPRGDLTAVAALCERVRQSTATCQR